MRRKYVRLLANYTDLRILFYRASYGQRLNRINADTAQLQTELWATVARLGSTQQTPIIALVVSGMNDVLNSQGYTQAAWWNRIPPSAWILMFMIGICCNLLIGYCIRRTGMEFVVFLVLTLVVSISFFLIADIDSPRGGIIRVEPQNLMSPLSVAPFAVAVTFDAPRSFPKLSHSRVRGRP